MFYVPVGSTEIRGPFESIEDLHRHAFDTDCESIMVCDTHQEAEECVVELKEECR